MGHEVILGWALTPERQKMVSVVFSCSCSWAAEVGMWQQGWRQHWPIRRCLSRAVLVLSSPEERMHHCSSCCETTRAVCLQKLSFKLRKLDPNTCSQLGIWNRANDIYYLDQRDLLFLKGTCKCFVASEQFACKVFLTTLIFGLGPKIPQSFKGWAWIFHLCCFWEDFLTYCSKRSHLCPAALTLPSPDGHCFSPPLQ